MATNEYDVIPMLDSTGRELAAEMSRNNDLLAQLVTAQGGTVSATDWNYVQRLVRSGQAANVFPVGTQLACKRGDTEIVWDVIGHDHDVPVDASLTYSMTLQMHDVFASMQFDAPEAFAYTDSKIASGTTLHFTLPHGEWEYDTAAYQFTVDKEIPAGAQFCFAATRVKPTATTVTVYTKGTTTVVTSGLAITAGSEGTELTHVNSPHRICYGNNNWAESGLRQWLNTDKAASVWWEAKNGYDRPHASVGSAGFLNGFDSDFLAVLGEVKKTTMVNDKWDGSYATGSEYQTKDKMFLLSYSELYMGAFSGHTDEAAYDYYSKYSDLSGAGEGNDSNRIKVTIGTSSAPYWWQRTPRANNANDVLLVSPAGSIDGGGAYGSHGVAPACNII